MMKSLYAVNRAIQHARRLSGFAHARHPVPGEGPAHARAMLVGEAPGKTEDATGRPFVGRSGKFLDQALTRAGIKRRKIFITSVLKFYPSRGKISRRDIELSLPWLIAQIESIRPRVVLLMGNLAKSVKDRLPRGPRYLTTVHPAAAMRFPKYRKSFQKTLRTVKKLARKID